MVEEEVGKEIWTNCVLAWFITSLLAHSLNWLTINSMPRKLIKLERWALLWTALTHQMQKLLRWRTNMSSFIRKSQIIHKTSNWHQSIALFLCFRGIWGIRGVSGMASCSQQNRCCHQVGNASGQVGSFSASENSLKHSERNNSKCFIYHYHHILILIMFTFSETKKRHQQCTMKKISGSSVNVL